MVAEYLWARTAAKHLGWDYREGEEEELDAAARKKQQRHRTAGYFDPIHRLVLQNDQLRLWSLKSEDDCGERVNGAAVGGRDWYEEVRSIEAKFHNERAKYFRDFANKINFLKGKQTGPLYPMSHMPDISADEVFLWVHRLNSLDFEEMPWWATALYTPDGKFAWHPPNNVSLETLWEQCSKAGGYKAHRL